MNGSIEEKAGHPAVNEAAIEAAVECIAAGGTLAEAKGIDEKQVEGLYALAYQVYHAGDYAKAESVFATLCVLNHQEKRFWIGLGGARQQLEKHQAAAEAFAMASTLDLLDPVPPLHAGMCFMAMKEKEQAANAFRQVLLVSRDDPGLAQYAEKGQAMLELLGMPLYEDAAREA